MLPFQERVIAEKNDLDAKIQKLAEFLESPVFGKLSASDQENLRHQLDLMGQYSAVLGSRIGLFNRISDAMSASDEDA